MIDRFQARGREEGLSSAEGRVMDCHALDIPDASFEVGGSQFGVMQVPDQPRALRETVRVTKPGGRVFVTAYGSPAELEFLGFFIGALTASTRSFQVCRKIRRPLEFQVADPEVLRQRLVIAASRLVRRADGGAASVRLGATDVGLGQRGNPVAGCWLGTSVRSSGHGFARSLTACFASASDRMGEPLLSTRSTSALGTR